jgi:hypothetical protein
MADSILEYLRELADAESVVWNDDTSSSNAEFIFDEYSDFD